MDSPRTYWTQWAESLRRLRLDGFAIWLIESAGPFHLIGAQLLYMSQPFATHQWSDGLYALANLLEREDETQAFAALLKGPSL